MKIRAMRGSVIKPKIFCSLQQLAVTAPKLPMMKHSMGIGRQRLHGSVNERSRSKAECCHWQCSDLYLPLCDWIRTFGIHGIVSKHTTKSIQPTFFQVLDACYRIMFILPVLAVDLLIMCLY
jgi:hypothetical protein